MSKHKFFETQANNNLEDLKQYLDKKYIDMKEINSKDNDLFYDPGNHWKTYNIFHFYNKNIYRLQDCVRKLTIDACSYYNIDYDEQNYYIHGWFNYWPQKVNVGINPENLNYHDHGNNDPNLLHGYYCVSAEPSITHYRIDNNRFDNINKNDKVIVSKNGYPHSPGQWNEDYSRITIAYNIVPLKCLDHQVEQSGQFVKL